MSILINGCGSCGVGGNNEAQLQNKAISYMQAKVFEDGVWSPGNVEMDQAEEALVDMGAPEFRKGQHALQLIVNLYGVKQSYLVWMQDGEVFYYEMSGKVTVGSLSRSIYPTLKEKGWRSDDTRSSNNAESQKPSQPSYSEPRKVQETPSYEQSPKQPTQNTPTEVIKGGLNDLMGIDAGNYQFTESDLTLLSAKDLTYLRNSVYAKHGYVFVSDELNNYFKQFKWYHPNSSVTETVLNDMEKVNVNFIKRYQEQNGKTYKPQ